MLRWLLMLLTLTLPKTFGITVTRVPAYFPRQLRSTHVLLAANRRITAVTSEFARITFACCLVGDTLHGKTAGIVELSYWRSTFAVSASWHARPWRRPRPNMSLVNDEHVVDEYVSYELWERLTPRFE